MKFILAVSLVLIVYIQLSHVEASTKTATDQIITAWVQSTGKGFGNFITNVNKIQYSDNYVYVSTNSIPTYTIGPWTSNPNNASAMGYTFKFPRYPSSAASKFSVPLGHVGLWKNGVSFYNADDGQTYNSAGVWHRNAYVWEGVSFDSCKGHPDGSSEYHHHISPSCLYTTSSSSHSPLIGFAFDGYPIYGPYGYSSANSSSSSIKRILTSWKLRSITDRTTLSNGTVLSASLQGPAISDTYPLKSFIEDYEYSAGYGDLDYYNGRWCVTPEYPSGTYAYFVATDSNLDPVYPFVVGPSFYGTVVGSNMGTSSGKQSVSETTTVYYQYSSATRFNSSIYLLLVLLPLFKFF